MRQNELLRKAFLMEKVEAAASSVFIGHGYVLHGGSE